MKRSTQGIVIMAICIIAPMWLCGCQVAQKKAPIHKGYVCYTNATVVEVKNPHEQLKFLGPGTKPEKKKMCEVVMKTDQNEMTTASREGYAECSTNTVNSRVMVYTFNGQIIGINNGPDPYLEENKEDKEDKQPSK